MQQLQCAAACADEDIFRVNSMLFAAVDVFNGHVPRVIAVALKLGHFRGGLQRKVFVLLQATNQLAGNFAIVDVSTHRRPGGSHFLLRIATGHDQRRPLGNLLMIGREFHALEQRGFLQRIVALAEIFHIFIAPHKTHMWSGINKGVRIIQYAALHLRRPELAGDHKLFVNFQRFSDINAAVRALRRVV